MLYLFNKYIDHIIKENSLTTSDELRKRVKEHLDKLDKLILFLIKSYLLLLDCLSRILFFKSFLKIKNKEIHKLKNLLFLLKFIIKKIDQIFYVVITLHTYGNEGLEVIKPKYKERYSNNNDKHYKFIVLGSGPSGAVTALELVKKYPGKVLIIEKGNSYNIPSTKHPGDEFIKKWYRGGINSTYFPDMVAYSSGSCFGGGSEINSGLYHAPDQDFLERWTNEFGTIDLEAGSMETYIKKVNSLTNLAPNNHDKFTQKFIGGATKAGQKITDLRRFINASEERNSMSVTLLKEFISKGGDIKLDTCVNNISFKNKRWQVNSEKNKQKIVYSSDYLFLCCGSIFTNDLLLRSNLIKKVRRKILRKFKFHPMIKIIASYDDELQELNEDVISHQNIEFFPDFIIGNATSSIQFLISSFQNNKEIKEYIDKNWKKMKVFHGTFSLGSGQIFRIPFLKEPILSYHINRLEKMFIYEGFSKIISFIKSTGAERVIPVKDGELRLNECKDELTLLESIKNIKKFQISSVHILGGVTMGENDNCIVDSYGKVKGHEAIYVNDSSLINTTLLKNPQGTVMSIAYRNIDNFIKKL